MELAKVTVVGTRAITQYCRDIPKGIVGAEVTIVFDDPIWEGLRKTAVFAGCCTKDVLDIGNVVKIPHEVVSEAGGYLRMGVYGVDAEGNLIIPTLWATLGRIRDAADPAGDPSADPTPPVWAQLEIRMKNLEENAGGGLSITSDGAGSVSISSYGAVAITSDGAGSISIG